MTLRKLLERLNKIAEETDLETDVYIEHEDESYTKIAGIEVEDGGDINIY